MSAPVAPAETPRWVTHALIPGVNLAVAFVLSGVLIAIIGENPVEALKVLLYGALG